MKIYIPTVGRADRQRTLMVMPDEFDVTLVVQHHERKLYGKYGRPIMVLPRDIRTIGRTRKYIVSKTLEEDIIMIDDDVQFYRRKPDGYLEGNFRDIKGLKKIAKEALLEMQKLMKAGIVHCGISAREGNNRVTDDYVDCTRMMRVLGWKVGVMKTLPIKFDRMQLMEDFDVTLQLLTLGYHNRVLYTYAQGQKSSNEDGGCSTYRTPELQEHCAKKLKSHFPDFVDVVEKVTKTSWGGGTRTDVRIKWKKAYQSFNGKEIA